MKKLLLFAMFMAIPVLARAQNPVITPTTVKFDHDDANFALVSGYRVEFYQCASYAPGPPESCQGRPNSPFQTATYPKSAVTSTTGSTSRKLSLTVPPGSGIIGSMPAGVAFVAAVVAIADPTTGSSGEARSADSNPFFGKGRSLAVPTNVLVQ